MKPYIIEYLDSQYHYAAVIIGISYESPIVYLDKISDELRRQGVCGEILFDMLLYSGNGLDRFFEIYFDGMAFDKSSAKNIKIERLTPLRKRTCEILFRNPEFVEESVLSKQQKELIKHGCCI